LYIYIYIYMYLYTLRIMGSRVIGGLNWRSTSEPCEKQESKFPFGGAGGSSVMMRWKKVQLMFQVLVRGDR